MYLLTTDGLFLPAEHHLLASGKRDAATLLADMIFEWNEKGRNPPGPYACRGVLPWVVSAVFV